MSNSSLPSARWVRTCGEQSPTLLLNYVPEWLRTDAVLGRICSLADSLRADDVPNVLPTRMSAALCKWFEEDITRGLAMAVAVMTVHAEIVRPQDGEDVKAMRMTLFNRLTAICPTEQIAAAQAVQQLGGASPVGIPGWMDQALRDNDYPVCQCILKTVKLNAHNTAPGRDWFEGPSDLGWLVFAGSDPARPHTTKVPS